MYLYLILISPYFAIIVDPRPSHGEKVECALGTDHYHKVPMSCMYPSAISQLTLVAVP